MLRAWEELPASVKRILTVIFFLLISLLITFAGALKPLNMEEAEEINKEMEKIHKSVSEVDLFRGTTIIFGNNFVLCLLFFVPFLGPIFGFSILYNTGVVVAAQSVSEGANPVLALLSLFIFPFAWMEFLAYSIAFTQSLWLIFRTIQGAWKKELINTCIMVTICAVILLTAAIIEMAIIQAFTAAS
ncbi:MAG: hypothetical protein QXK18_07925 [Candidatus Bathyarchaeia archaeon]